MENIKVLVIDDSTTMRRIVKNVVSQIGINKENILEGEDGVQGMEEFNKAFNSDKPIDVVLCDINMPNMNGFEVVENIRKIDKKVFISMITTEGGKTEVIRALKLGSNQYIVKPFNAETLKEKLSPIIEKIQG
jgi:two-component system chemotaxis response regulator CheY